MRDALEAQGTPVEPIVHAGEGHGFLFEAQRLDFDTRAAPFLGEQRASR